VCSSDLNGHDKDAIAAAIASARADDRPSMIACSTIIGFGAPNKQGTAATHGAPLGAEEIIATRAALGWTHPAFEIPDAVYSGWHAISARGNTLRAVWRKRLDQHMRGQDFMNSLTHPEMAPLRGEMSEYKARLSAEQPKVATRKASEMALEVVNATLPNSIGGSADLTGSNLTRTKGMQPLTRDNYGGDYIHYGVREHAMAAAMNGIALHGGFVTYGGTFLVFADYCRPAIRLSALMNLPVTYVMTHDSIGLGEDGPTHQPVETIASLRAIPNLNVLRPADAVETAEAWELTALSTGMPHLMCLSRQGLPVLRTTHTDENLTARGAFVLRDVKGARDITLIATGSEVELAMEAAETLQEKGINAAVVSAPCFEMFAKQDAD